MGDQLIRLAIEEDDSNLRKYKRIHKSGCRDLRDPMPIAAADFADLAYQAVGYGVIDDESERDELRAMLAPCAVEVLP